MKKHTISVAVDPDRYSSGHSKKRALLLLVGATVICCAAMELCRALSLSLPLPVLIGIHAAGLGVLAGLYRWLQLRSQQEGLR